jgi:hypothetical protein
VLTEALTFRRTSGRSTRTGAASALSLFPDERQLFDAARYLPEYDDDACRSGARAARAAQARTAVFVDARLPVAQL